jgi:hypothetical protein
MTPVSVVVVGAGVRGTGYARWARRHPDRASVVAVAEPREVRRARFAAEHGIATGNAVADWRQLAGRGAATATFTMTAFSKAAGRSTRLFGTRAELTGDGETIRIYDFLSRAERLITPPPAGAMDAAKGHGGGDAGLMDAFTGAVATGNRDLILSGPRESLASHLAVFAAERARVNGTVETIPPAGQADASSS